MTQTENLTWTNPVPSAPYKLVILTPTTLFAAKMTPEQLTAAEEALEAGTPPMKVAGPRAVVVPLKAIIHTRAEVLTNILSLKYVTANDTGFDEVTIPFSRLDEANAVFLAIREFLGDGYMLRAHNHSRFRVSIAPLAVFAAIVVVAIVLGIIASSTQFTAIKMGPLGRERAGLWTNLCYTLGWKGPAILAGLSGVVCGAWAFKRIRAMPITFTLEKQK